MSEKWGTACTYPNASYASEYERVMLGKRSTANLESDHVDHSMAFVDRKSLDLRTLVSFAESIASSRRSAMTTESLTCSASPPDGGVSIAIGTFLYVDLQMHTGCATHTT